MSVVTWKLANANILSRTDVRARLLSAETWSSTGSHCVARAHPFAKVMYDMRNGAATGAAERRNKLAWDIVTLSTGTDGYTLAALSLAQTSTPDGDITSSDEQNKHFVAKVSIYYTPLFRFPPSHRRPGHINLGPCSRPFHLCVRERTGEMTYPSRDNKTRSLSPKGSPASDVPMPG